jgi:hypothetical protein
MGAHQEEATKVNVYEKSPFVSDDVDGGAIGVCGSASSFPARQ